jgi:hypothetical protein
MRIVCKCKVGVQCTCGAILHPVGKTPKPPKQ